MTIATEHASTERGSMELLEEFQRLNPNLEEGRGEDGAGWEFCDSLIRLLTPRHRWDNDCCPNGAFQTHKETCLVDHQEVWRDRETGTEVMITHPYCWHNLEDHHHREMQDVLAARGLAYRVSEGSWYAPGDTALAVTARADIAGRITLPEPPEGPRHGPKDDMTERCPLIDWPDILEKQLRKEARKRDGDMAEAAWREEQGEMLAALRHYADNAYVDRMAGFNELALDQLVQAKRVITMQPWLDVEMLYFHTREDRRYICGPGEPILDTRDIQARLMAISMPEGWSKFTANSSQNRRRARAEITQNGQGWGIAEIRQGGNRNRWAASVECSTGGRFSTVDGEDYQSLGSPKNFCLKTPEDAVRAALDIFRRFDELAEQRLSSRNR